MGFAGCELALPGLCFSGKQKAVSPFLTNAGPLFCDVLVGSSRVYGALPSSPFAWLYLVEFRSCSWGYFALYAAVFAS